MKQLSRNRKSGGAGSRLLYANNGLKRRRKNVKGPHRDMITILSLHCYKQILIKIILFKDKGK